jgi:RNA polymerase sigma-70 factor (ECF subfamily)
MIDPDLLGRLIDRHAAALELYARQWCESADDVVQEAYVKLASQAPAPDHPAAWLFRAVRNGALNAGRASRRRRRHEAEAAAAAPPWFEPRPGVHRSAEIDAESAETALAELPIEQREIVVAHLWGRLTFDQIGELVGSSASSAHRLYHAGLVALRERLGVPCPTRTTIPSHRATR